LEQVSAAGRHCWHQACAAATPCGSGNTSTLLRPGVTDRQRQLGNGHARRQPARAVQRRSPAAPRPRLRDGADDARVTTVVVADGFLKPDRSQQIDYLLAEEPLPLER